MKKVIALLLALVLLSACGNQAAVNPPPPSSEAVSVETVVEPEPETQATESSQSAAPVIGKEVIPITEMKAEIPWLDYDPGHVPALEFLGFNIRVNPQDSQAVRLAISYCVDRERMANGAKGRATSFPEEIQPASILIPPGILGRDVYGEIGLTYDPAAGAQKLADAGYAGGEGFPEIELVYYANPGNESMAAALIEDWEKGLNISVTPKPFSDADAYYAYLDSEAPYIFITAFIADFNDPSNFTRDFFTDYYYSNPVLGKMNDDAEALAADPPGRQSKYIEIAKMLCEDDAAIIPLYFFTTAVQ